MGMDAHKRSGYRFDSGWSSEAEGNDSTWGTDASWSKPESAKSKPPKGNGGASFAAWEKKASPEPTQTIPLENTVKRPAFLEPGFYVVPLSMSGDKVLANLFPDGTHANLIARAKALNPTFNSGFKAGEMFVLGDLLNTTACLREEADLMIAAAQVRTALEPLTEDEANFMVRHQAEIALMVGGASTSLGVGKDMLEAGLKKIGGTLRDLEYLHQREFTANGHLRSPEFFATRKQLYAQLDAQLKSTFLNKQLGLGSYETLRRDLGISTKSLVHHWSKAGVPGQIPGYATHMNEIAKAAKYLKHGGYIGTGLGGLSSYLNIREACKAGETEECKKARFTETSSFAGSFVGGTAGPAIASRVIAGPLCAAIGFGSAGLGGMACALIVVGAGSLTGGDVGEDVGEVVGELLYEAAK